MNTRKQREQEQLRLLIIETAWQLVAEKGAHGFTIRELAHRIEYSPRTIYLYFQDKHDLLQHVIEMGFEKTLEFRYSNPLPAYYPPEKAIEQRIRDHIAAAQSQPHFYRAVAGLLLEGRYQAGPAQQEIMEQTAQEIAVCMSSTGKQEDVKAVMLVLFPVLRGFTLSILDNDSEDIPGLIDRFVAMVMAHVTGR